MGFGFDDRIYWTFMQLVTTVTNHYLTHWHLPRLDFLSPTEVNYSSQSHSLLYSLGADSIENMSIAYQWSSTPLLRILCREMCLPVRYPVTDVPHRWLCVGWNVFT
jgi:hypothetical protein